jgi:cytochrome c oxidase subunit 2
MIRALLLIFNLLQISVCYADKPHEWQVDFQAAASPIMEELHSFHNFLLFIITAIVVFVLVLLGYVIFRFSAKRNPIPAKFTHNIAVEVIWTVIPIIILIIIAVPSFRVLRMVEHSPPAEVIVKVVGSQWYWSYSYPDHGNIEFDSNLIQDKDLKPGQIRLLEVDNRIVVPQGSVIKFLVTASDVLHSFAIPSLGIKTDAVPGKVTQTWTKIDKKGVYYGQCSELCGVNHGFMPIAIEVVSKEEFDEWIKKKETKTAAAEPKVTFAKKYH